MIARRNLPARAVATEKTLRIFRDRAFDWRSGATCIHLAHLQATNMEHILPDLPNFSTQIGALRQLRRQGVASLADLLDLHFERIAPSRMLIGDLALLPHDPEDDAIEAITIFDGLAKLIGWHGAQPDRLSNISRAGGHIIAAWAL